MKFHWGLEKKHVGLNVYTQQAPRIRGSEPEYPLSAYPLSLLTINEYDNNTCVLYWLNDIRKSNQPPGKSLKFINTLLLIISEVETNPGPIKYPCGVCSMACRWNQKALACDDCDQWFHTSCMGVSHSAYDNLANTSVSWYCTNCNRPNHSTLPYDLSSSVTNRFSSLQPDSFNSTMASIDSILMSFLNLAKFREIYERHGFSIELAEISWRYISMCFVTPICYGGEDCYITVSMFNTISLASIFYH
jgi:hypothetical protein